MKRREFLKSAAAASLLAATGGKAGANAGGPLPRHQITTATAQFDPARPEMARLCAQAFRQIGWEVDANPIDYNQGVQKVVMEHDFDMFIVGLPGHEMNVDPDYYTRHCFHSAENKRGGFNWMGYSNPKFDEVATEQRRRITTEERRPFIYEAQEIIDHDQPSTVLAYMNMPMAHRSDRISGLVPDMAEGIGSFWSDVNMEVGGDGYSRTGINTDITHLNPVAAVGIIDFKELRTIYDRLMRVGPDGTVQPWAATALKFVNDTTMDLTIRQGMKWHDGKDVTVEDVVFSFDYQKEWKAPYFLSFLNNVKSVTAPASDTVRIELDQPSAPFVAHVLAGMFIIPKHIWENIHKTEAGGDPIRFANSNPIGSGPFKFNHWARGSELKVSAFKEHFSAPKCAGFIRTVYGSHDAVAAAIERGECDRTRYLVAHSLLESLQGMKNVVAKSYPNHGFYSFSYNTRKAPYDNAAFRRALNLVIPRQAIAELVLFGAEPGGSIISPSNPTWYNPKVKSPTESVTEARNILQKAGYTWNSAGKLLLPA